MADSEVFILTSPSTLQRLVKNDDFAVATIETPSTFTPSFAHDYNYKRTEE